jgi:type I restriction enzyme S subunit
MAQLSELCDLVTEHCDPGSSGASVYVGLEHIDGGRYRLQRHGRPDDVQSAKHRFGKGDILYGKLRPYLDKAVLAETDGICSTDILVLRPKEDVCSEYLLGLIHSPDFLAHAAATTKGVNHPRTSWSGLSSFEWQVPEKSDQQQIGAVLSKVQRAIEIEEKLIATTRELKQAAMRQLFAFGTRRDDTRDTPYGQVPASWDIQPLSDCATVQTGVTKGRAIPPDEAIEVPYLRVANVQDGYLDLTEIKSITIRRGELDSYRLQEGDVVLTEGGDFDKLGRGFIWHGQIEPCIHQNHVFAVRTNRDVLVPEFLAYLAQSPYGRSYFLTVAHKTTNLACINSTKLKAFPVPLPALKDQQELVELLGGIDRKAQVHESRRRILLDIFDRLLKQLMSGHLFVDGLQPS